ncbi:MAG: Sec-C motif domain protein [Flavobacteriaceae bacterium]|nr:Sec-C motif domain protein [Flavobacteriaceae bacterium]
MTTCNCGNEKSYTACCEIIHNDITKAQTAVQLMRSRYTAFCRADGAYLAKSQAEKFRPTVLETEETIQWAKSVTWVKLEILETSDGLEKDSRGTVTFKATYFDAGGMGIIEEKSLFEKENGHWVYVTGI